jgi:hypothetical protein
MQTIYIDISNKNVIPIIYAKQGDVGRKFLAVLTDGSVPYSLPTGYVLSVWYDGDSGEGNYTHIGKKSAFYVDGNRISIEMITQMLSVPGKGNMCLVLNYGDNQVASWNIEYVVESVPGAESEKAKEYYTAFSKAVSELPYPDETLSIAGKSADAAATGAALAGKAPAGFGLNNDFVTVNNTAALDSYFTCGWVRYIGGSVDQLLGYNQAIIRIDSYTNSVGNEQVYQTAHLFGGTKQSVSIIQRFCFKNNWQPWEWVNPPMDVGVEYRTIERYNGKPVYVQCVNFGAMPNASSKQVLFTSSGDIDRALSVTGSSSIGDTIPYRSDASDISICVAKGVNRTQNYVNIKTTNDQSSRTAEAVVKYTLT